MPKPLLTSTPVPATMPAADGPRIFTTARRSGRSGDTQLTRTLHDSAEPGPRGGVHTACAGGAPSSTIASHAVAATESSRRLPLHQIDVVDVAILVVLGEDHDPRHLDHGGLRGAQQASLDLDLDLALGQRTEVHPEL
jgi:hypothetical protein